MRSDPAPVVLTFLGVVNMHGSENESRSAPDGVTYLRLDDVLDRPLYRIFPLWAFEDMLRVKRLVLVPPTFWEDPFEDLAASIMMQGPNHAQKPLSEYLNATHCQCWSFESESDVLLRAYSRVMIDKLHSRNSEPRFEGVQVRTTPRKLAAALRPWAERVSGGQFYLGRVEYAPQHDTSQRVVNILSRIGPYEMGRGENRAQSLLLKRNAFAHEDEVRLIRVNDNCDRINEPLTVNIEPNAFIEDVRFDPRLITFERREREQMARTLRYEGAFSESGLYQKTFFQTVLPWNWDEWEHGARPPSAP